MSPELAVRLGCFLAVFIFSAAWELAAPKRGFTVSRPWRWAGNLGLLILDTAVLRLCLPLLAVNMAVISAGRGWGLLNHVQWPFRVKILAAFLFLDFVIYVQHWCFHRVPIFWRMHKVHHTDLDLDVTSGVRFHPAEILVSMAIKLAAVAAIGAHLLAVILFEVVLNATSLFNHANIRVPPPLERLLRLFLVTPDMHRVHHSVIVGETNSNYGFNLPWWDRMLGTYTAQPAQGHLGMTIGLPDFRDSALQNLWWLIALPFR